MASYTLQEHGALRVLPVPLGLRELASDLSREVLRAQPSNLLGFAADYMTALLKARSSAVAAAEAVGQMLTKDVTYASLLARRGVTMEEAQRATVVIQAAFRGFCTRRDLRKSGLLLMDPVTHKYAVFRVVADHAVARIQAAFRGYMVRKILHQQSCSASAWLTDDFPRSKIMQYLLKTVGMDVANDAATKIQAIFRGFSTRHSLEQKLYEELRKESWTKKESARSKQVKDYTIVSGREIVEMDTDDEKKKMKKKMKNELATKVQNEIAKLPDEDEKTHMEETELEIEKAVGFKETSEVIPDDILEQATGSPSDMPDDGDIKSESSGEKSSED